MKKNDAKNKALHAKMGKELKVKHSEGTKFSSSYGVKDGKPEKRLHGHRVSNSSFGDYGK